MRASSPSTANYLLSGRGRGVSTLPTLLFILLKYMWFGLDYQTRWQVMGLVPCASVCHKWDGGVSGSFSALLRSLPLAVVAWRYYVTSFFVRGRRKTPSARGSSPGFDRDRGANGSGITPWCLPLLVRSSSHRSGYHRFVVLCSL